MDDISMANIANKHKMGKNKQYRRKLKHNSMVMEFMGHQSHPQFVTGLWNEHGSTKTLHELNMYN